MGIAIQDLETDKSRSELPTTSSSNWFIYLQLFVSNKRFHLLETFIFYILIFKGY